MTKEIRSANDEGPSVARSLSGSFGFGHSFGFRHLSFVIFRARLHSCYKRNEYHAENPGRHIRCRRHAHPSVAIGRTCLRRGCRKAWTDRKSTRLNSSHSQISYAVFCLKKKKKNKQKTMHRVLCNAP